MNKPVAIVRARDKLPSQRLFTRALLGLVVMSLPVLASPAPAQARTVGRALSTAGTAPTAKLQPKRAERAYARRTPPKSWFAASTARGAGDLIGVTSDLYTTGSVTRTSLGNPSQPAALDSAAYAPKPVARTVGLSSPALAPRADVDPAAAEPRTRPRSWYPEAHNYLRPYHYRWRYWTPG